MRNVFYLSVRPFVRSSVTTGQGHETINFGSGLCRHAVSVCLSVRLSVVQVSVMFVYSVETTKHIIKLLSLSGIATAFSFSVPNVMAVFQRGPPMGASNEEDMKKSRFSTNISFYVGNDIR